MVEPVGRNPIALRVFTFAPEVARKESERHKPREDVTIKRILITGANKGIGLAAVKAILENHADASVLLGSRDVGRGRAAIDELCQQEPGWHSRLDLLEIDVASDQSVAAASEQVVNRYGAEPLPLWGVVNNAGIGFGSSDLDSVVNVNTLGVKRVCDAFISLVQQSGRIVVVSSASAPRFVSQCSAQRRAFFKDSRVEWVEIQKLVNDLKAAKADPRRLDALGLGDAGAYGFSKACASLYTMMLARENPGLYINACTPGYIETDLTRPHAQNQGLQPADLGMKPPSQGTVSILFLLFGAPHGSGHYYGSDAKRSPLDDYRAPGSPEYMGE